MEEVTSASSRGTKRSFKLLFLLSWKKQKKQKFKALTSYNATKFKAFVSLKTYYVTHTESVIVGTKRSWESHQQRFLPAVEMEQLAANWTKLLKTPAFPLKNQLGFRREASGLHSQ